MTNVDCNGVQNGPALVDDCGVCQLAYIYNFVTHVPTFISDTSGLVLGPTEALILPNNPTNPLWNASCQGCTDPLALNYDSSATIDDGSCTYAPVPVQAPLFFSEYAEGSSNNKYFEIFNPTSDTIFLSNYAYPSVANAPTTAGQYEYWNDFDAGSYILPNDVYVVAHPSADPLILALADETHQYLSNGDDGYGLVYGNQSSYVVIDWLGDWNGDPGSGWSVAGVSNATKDHTLVRKCGVLTGNTSWTNSSGVDSVSSEWLVYPNETWMYLGTHDVTCQIAIYGCMDSLAINFDSTATVDDGSCIFPPVDCYGIVNGISIIDSCGVCQPAIIYNYVTHVATPLLADTSSVVLGPTEMIVLASSPMNTYWNSSCSGCTDPTALNYDSTATIDDGSCIAIVYGCTNPAAINYFPGANVDDGSCCLVAGCTDPTASNYDPNACIDDGSCIIGTTCSGSPITNLGVTNIIHNRATFTFDDMNSSTCRVDQLRIKYREVGTTAWSQKNMGSPTGYDPVTGICNSTSRTDKLVLGLSANTTYEWQMRVWYCSTGATAWVNGPNFTTLADCPNVGNLAVTTPTNTKATFTWDNSNGAYSFVRLQARVDTTGSSFFNIGGVGVLYGTYTKDKNGLVPGTTYRAKSRTWCDPNGGAYKAPSWTSFIYFTMPGSVRLDGGTSIESLDVYPNPSRDIFNVSFTSKEAQDLEVRVINVVGEVVYTEGLENFTGEYAKEIDLVKYTKGIYFLEITTDNGVINKKLILQ